MNEIFKQLRDEYDEKVVQKIKELMNDSNSDNIIAFLSADSVGYYFNTKVESDGFEADGIGWMEDIVVNGKTWHVQLDAECGSVRFIKKKQIKKSVDNCIYI